MENKKTIIIIPGWEGSKQSWQSFLDYANKQNEFNFICIELPCFGHEPCPDQVWGVEEYADYVKRKLTELNFDKPVLLGHSFGGQVSTYLVAHHNELVSELILSGASSIRKKRIIKRLFFGTIAKIGKFVFRLPLINKLAPEFKKVLYKMTGSQDYAQTSGIKREIYQKVNRQDLTNLLPQIKNRSLVVWGKKDTYVTWRDGQKIAQNLPDSKFVLVPDGKHGLHIQQPDNFYKIIANFLNTFK